MKTILQAKVAMPLFGFSDTKLYPMVIISKSIGCYFAKLVKLSAIKRAKSPVHLVL